MTANEREGQTGVRRSQERRRIAEYVAGEMSAEEKARFERLMGGDESLRREVAQWRAALEAARDWMESEPPGAERVDSLPIPLVRARRGRPARIIPMGFRVWGVRAAAAAAIFLIGLAIGRATSEPQSSSPLSALSPPSPLRPPTENAAIKGAAAPELEQNAPAPGEEAPASRAPSASKPAPSAPGERMLASAAAPVRRTTIDPEGRVVIETSLSETGAQAVWVVDGKFRLDAAATP